MQANLYIPFWMSTALYCLSWLITFTMEEQDSSNGGQRYAAISDADHTTPARTVQNSDQDSPISPGSPVWSVYSPTLQDVTLTRSFRTKLKFQENIGLFHGPASYFCLATFFFKRISFASEISVAQYASEKFGWPLHQISWLKSATALGAVSATLIACPLVTSCLWQRGFAAYDLDIGVIRVSLLAVMAAFFSVWKASSAPFFWLCVGSIYPSNSGVLQMNNVTAMFGCGLGEGIRSALQGILVYLTDSSRNAQMFATIVMVDTMGELTGGPLTARRLAIGRRADHPSFGICYLVSSVSSAHGMQSVI